MDESDIPQRPTIEIWEPTYRMEPKEGCRFQAFKVDAILREVLDSTLTDFEYEHEAAKELSLKLSDQVREKVQGEKFLCGYS